MLGILGGMGPLATVDFMAKVIKNTPASIDQDHIEMVVCSSSKIPDRTAAILSQGTDPLPSMLKSLRFLELADVICIAIPCNTAHFWHDKLQENTSIPILHIVDAVANSLSQRGMSGATVGVLAGSGMIHSQAYQMRLGKLGYPCLTPNSAGQDDVMRAIRLVKAGDISGATSILAREVKSLVSRGCQQVAMACTEIPVALDSANSDLGSILIDPTELLAKACVKKCLG